VDQIKSQVDSLADLNDEQVAQLQESIVSEFESFESQDPTAESVDAMTSLADMLDTVRGEVQRREAAMQELTARAAEAASRVKGDGNGQDEMGSDMPSEDVVPTEGEGPAEEETPAETIAEGGKEEEMPEMGDMPVTDEEPANPQEVDAPGAPAEDTPAEGAPEEGTPEEEAGETPAEEDEEKKKKDMESYSSTESLDASAEAVENSEFSTKTENTTEAEAPAEAEATITEAVELSVETEAVEAPAEQPNQTEIVEETQQEEQAIVTASAEQPFEAPADRQPVIEVVEPAKVAITAGADIPGYTAGSTINDMIEVASAMEKRIHSLRRVNGGDGEQHIVASLTTEFPESRTLSTDAESNMLKIAAVAGPEALVASGGHAAPFEVKYDIYSIGSTTVRPIRDSLPRFQADRGGIRFVTPPGIAKGFTSDGSTYTTYDNAVGVWTSGTDLSPSGATKTSLTVTAAYEQTVSTDAVTLQVQFGNLMTRAYPELIARHNELALVQHAREAEQNLVSKLSSGSTAVTTTNLIGFGRDFLVQIRRAAVAYRSRHRIDVNTQLQAIIPFWVYDAMAADLTLAMPGDGTLSVSQAEINGYLANSNVTLVASPDMTVFGSQGAAALLEFPDSFDWYLFAEGTFLFLDGGTLDLGIIRDSTLVGTNDYKMFIETFENVAKIGLESLKITSTISINGVAAALRDTTGGVAAATIEL